jgi:hypothetical protein
MPGPFASCSHQISCHCADKLPASRNNGTPDQVNIERVLLVLTHVSLLASNVAFGQGGFLKLAKLDLKKNPL